MPAKKKQSLLLVLRGRMRELAARRGFTQVSEASLVALAKELENHLLNRLDLLRAGGITVRRLTPGLARYAVRSIDPSKGIDR